MAGEFDIASQVAGYGSPGATALFGVQQELMRRAQLKQEADIRALAQQRQQQQDELQRQRVEQEIAASKENVASNVATRTETAAKTKQAATDTAIKGITDILSPGPSSAAAADAVAKLDPVRAGLLFARTPVAATPGTEPLQPGDAGPEMPAVPAHEDVKYLGNDAQRTAEERKQRAFAVLNGESDTGNESVDAIEHARAQHFLNTGKDASATDLAAILKTQGKPSPAETKSAHDLAIEKILSKPEAQWTPDEQAMVAGRKAFNKLQGAEAATRLHVTVGAANDRALATEVRQVKQNFRKDLSTEDAKLSTDLERVDRAQKVLNSKNFLADAVAAPEVLQIVAGGMGSGLRMTTAELDRVNNAQTKLDQARAELAKWGVGAPVAIQEELRKNMQAIIATVKTARERKAKLLEDTLGKLDEATTPAEVDALHATYWGQRRAAGDTNSTGAPEGDIPPGVVVRKVAKP